MKITADDALAIARGYDKKRLVSDPLYTAPVFAFWCGKTVRDALNDCIIFRTIAQKIRDEGGLEVNDPPLPGMTRDYEIYVKIGDMAIDLLAHPTDSLRVCLESREKAKSSNSSNNNWEPTPALPPTPSPEPRPKLALLPIRESDENVSPPMTVSPPLSPSLTTLFDDLDEQIAQMMPMEQIQSTLV